MSNTYGESKIHLHKYLDTVEDVEVKEILKESLVYELNFVLPITSAEAFEILAKGKTTVDHFDTYNLGTINSGFVYLYVMPRLKYMDNRILYYVPDASLTGKAARFTTEEVYKQTKLQSPSGVEELENKIIGRFYRHSKGYHLVHSNTSGVNSYLDLFRLETFRVPKLIEWFLEKDVIIDQLYQTLRAHEHYKKDYPDFQMFRTAVIPGHMSKIELDAQVPSANTRTGIGVSQSIIYTFRVYNTTEEIKVQTILYDDGSNINIVWQEIPFDVYKEQHYLAEWGSAKPIDEWWSNIHDTIRILIEGSIDMKVLTKDNKKRFINNYKAQKLFIK